MLQPFQWGRGGQVLTPDQVARRREMAEAAQGRAGDTSPVAHWTQGATRVVDALSGVVNERRADAGEAAGMAAAEEYVQGSPVLSGLMGGGGASFSLPQTADAVALRQGLVARGLPEHVADAFVLNFQDESGLDPGINEREPLVPGSRGGFGLYQLTGPRRVAYEQFAAERGVDPTDVDAQLDFLVAELQGPEARAAQSILSAPDTGTAAAAIVNEFLRPAEEHRAARAARYAGGGGMDASGQPMPVTGGGGDVVGALAGAMSNPWVAQRYGPVIEALMGQQMRRGDMQFEQQLAQADPMYQAQLDQLQNPRQELPASVQEMQWQAQQLGLQPGTPEYQDFIRSGGAAGANAGVRSSQILEDGTLIQSTDAGPRVFGADGTLLEGQAAAAAIAEANRVRVQNERDVYSGRRTGTLEADIGLGGEAAASVRAGEIAQERGAAAYDAFAGVQSSLSNIDEAIAAIDSGAESGIGQKYLPNITLASATLNNAMNRMGLDVIGSVTFGALSEAEMNLAMDVAVPRDLSPPELRAWLVSKRDAQEKAAAALWQAGQYLSTPGNTLQTWMEQQGQNVPAIAPPPVSPSPVEAPSPTTQDAIPPEAPPDYLEPQDAELWEYYTPEERAAVLRSYGR